MTPTISRRDLLSWLSQLLNTHAVIAPIRVGERVVFEKISSVERITLDYDNSAISPKWWFFPPTETLFTVDRKDGQTQIAPARVIEDAVLFGLRSCDARGIALIDHPFLAPPADAEYQRRRARTTLIGLSCVKACSTCFCTSLGSAPDDSSHVDIMLTEAGESYLVKCVTDKGKALLASSSVAEAQASPPAAPSLAVVPTAELLEAAPLAFDHSYWDRLADRCVGCNLCAYICPTCYCFDIRDYTDKGKIERIRTWESCQSRGFVRIAGGYDPRPTKGARLRQRFYHKLLYFPKEFGAIACTGCGRCVRYCPVNIDIREVIVQIQKLGRQSGTR